MSQKEKRAKDLASQLLKEEFVQRFKDTQEAYSKFSGYLGNRIEFLTEMGLPRPEVEEYLDVLEDLAGHYTDIDTAFSKLIPTYEKGIAAAQKVVDMRTEKESFSLNPGVGTKGTAEEEKLIEAKIRRALMDGDKSTLIVLLIENSRRLAMIRRALEMTQIEFAEQIPTDSTRGTRTGTYISHIEKGKTAPRAHEIHTLVSYSIEAFQKKNGVRS